MQLEDLSTQLKEERSKVVALEVDQQNIANLQRSLIEVINQYKLPGWEMQGQQGQLKS